MDILIKDKNYSLREVGRFGREGEIYSIQDYSQLKLAKIYDPERRTAYTERKIIALINKFNELDLGGIENSLAYPEYPIYEANKRQFCGFLMKRFINHTDLFDNRYDLKRFAFKEHNIDDIRAISIIRALFTILEIVHKCGLIIGDVSPDNILLDRETLMPALVDFDSAQLGTFYSNTSHQTYIDPTVRTDGVGRKRHFIYTNDSDIYALAIVSYEFVVGIHPYFFQTSTPTDTEFKKTNELSLIDYLEKNRPKISRFPFEVFENAAYRATMERLKEIERNHHDLYSYFKRLFLEGKREYFSTSGIKVQTRGIGKKLDLEESEITDMLPQTKEDPEELELFMKQFNLRLV